MIEPSKLLSIIGDQKQSAFNFRERRHDPWDETYILYRDKVITNRLTQRQSVNIPLMKSLVKTILKDIDDAPLINFKTRSNDTQKDLIFGLVWDESARNNKLIIKDIVDKKNVTLFGRSFKSQMIYKGRHYWTVNDPKDFLVNRYTDPTNIDTARDLHHVNIYTSLTQIERTPMYDKEAVGRLKKMYASRRGLYKSEEITQAIMDKNNRMMMMGVPDVDNPILGETYLELNEHLIMLPNGDREEYYFVVTTVGTNEGEGKEILLYKPFEEIMGETRDHFWRNHTNVTSWGEDVEATDFWSDGPGDSVRTPAKIINSWLSQKTENRTLKNFGMRFYNASADANFVPQTFTPVPWGFYPTPGNPNELIKDVNIDDLDSANDDIAFVMGIAEKASSATGTSQGQIQERKVTLGEISLSLQEAKERVKSMDVFYNDAWEDFGLKYSKMVESSGHMIDDIEVTKSGKNTDRQYMQLISYKDYVDELGYTVEVKMAKDKSAENANKLQNMQYAKTLMPNNKKLADMQKKTALEFGGLDAGEIKEVMDEEKVNAESAAAAANPLAVATAAGMGGGTPTPQSPQAPIMQ